MNKQVVQIANALWRGTVIVSTIAVSATVLSWVADTEPPIEVKSAKARDTNVERGGTVFIDYHLETRRACRAVLQRVVIDSQDVVQIMESYSFRELSGVRKDKAKITIAVPVPVAASLGHARFRAEIFYQCNPLQVLFGRSIEVKTPDIEFNVLPAVSNTVTPAPMTFSKDGVRHSKRMPLIGYKISNL